MLLREGIRRIYVSPIQNNTYKPGVENLVYNQLVRTISASRRVELVQRTEDADAVLHGTVTAASYGPAGTTTADKLYPSDKVPGVPRGSTEVVVATEYNATLQCNFSLVARVPRPEKPESRPNATVWGSSFSRAKAFPGNNQLDVFGTTSPLINESEFDRALRDLARSMMSDLEESMLAMF
jgi:hypothetical protein